MGYEGMSGEETDDSSNTVNTVNCLREKRLLVRSARWLNSDIRRLFEIINTYETALDDRGSESTVREARFYTSESKVRWNSVELFPEAPRSLENGRRPWQASQYLSVLVGSPILVFVGN